MRLHLPKWAILVLGLFHLSVGQAQTTIALDSTVLTYRTVKDSLDIPWEILWGPDGWIWTTERYGRISRINPDNGQQQVILDLSASVYDQYEAGLLGMVLHPNFVDSPQVFIAYTYLQGSNILERLVRYDYNGTALVNPDTLIEGIPGNTTHIGARFLILPDRTLLMTTGDAQNTAASQQLSPLTGKTLRLNLDGSIPADNPIPGSMVWSWGHRNAQGLFLAPNGKLYSSEHGPTTDDELNILLPGRNYGWPTVTGYCDSPNEMSFCADSNVVEPIAAWTPTIAPSDLLWYNHPAIPEWNNKLLMTVLKDQKLISFQLNAAGDSVIREQHHFTGTFLRLRDICMAPDGRVFLATNGSSWSNTQPFTHKIIELKNNSYIPTGLASASVSTWQLGPNPSKIGQPLQVQGLDSEQPLRLRVLDFAGRLVFEGEYRTSGNLSLNLPLSAGLYVLVLEQGSRRDLFKWMLLD